MGGRSTHADILISGGRVRRVVGWWSRRVGAVVVLALLAGVVAPGGALPPEDGPTTLSWLWDWWSERPVWAFADPPTPKQQVGRGVSGHYVSSPRAKAFETPDKDKAKGELARYQPHRLGGGARTTAPAARGV